MGLERLLLRDRAIVTAALCLVITGSWFYILTGAGMAKPALDMSSLSMALGVSGETGVMPKDMSPEIPGTMVSMAIPADWTFHYAIIMFVMWWVMMLAMMLPSAAPMILLHARVTRREQLRLGVAGGLMPSAAFAAGYILVWGLFSVIAASLQWSFEAAGVLSPMMMNATSAAFAGGILTFAGIYQLSPVKKACLRHCRGPLQFLTRNWRPGASGACVMGLHHGAYCFGCCWGLMGILFFGGIMNLYWVIGLALIVLMEKLLPVGPRLGNFSGGLLLLAGSAFFVRSLT